MRILNVRFKNLNSLAGAWNIDFTHPAYASDGIFAITGPTGAGKTTILDAVCLALYGRTPRLNRVNKASNEIMSRLTGECFAEVSFETRAGRFRSHWSQHRARNKADGDLQPPRHEIYQADSGEIIESRLREVEEKIEALTGMDYERFTRSMLLAQGGFAAFLQAPSSERAPILEQITGTEIYSRISMKVHEQRTEEMRKLDKLKVDAAGIRLLDDEARGKLRCDLDEKVALEPRLIEQRDAAGKALLWLESMTRLEQDLDIIKERSGELKQRAELFQPDLLRLDKARRAGEMEADYIKISSKRDDQERELVELAGNKEKVPAAEENLTNVSNAHNSAQERLAAAQMKQRQELPVIKSVRELDINIENKVRQSETVQNKIEDSEKSFNETQNSILDLEISLQQSREKLDEIRQYLENNEVDSRLIGDLAAIEQIFNTWKDTDAQLSEARGKSTTLSGLVRQSEQALAGLEAKYNEMVLQNGKAAEKHRSISEAVKVLLEDREAEDWRRELDALKERQNILQQLCESRKKIKETGKSLEETALKRERLNGELSGLTEEIRWCENRQEQMEGEAGHLEIQLDLLKRIQSLEEQRSNLQDGQACPLCGSLHHPYAQGNIPIPTETASSLDKAKRELKTLVKKSAGLKVKQAEISKDLEQLRSNEDAFNSTLAAEDKASADFLKRLDVDVTDGPLPGIITKETEKVQSGIYQCSRLISEVEVKRKEEKQASQELEGLNKSRLDAEKKRDQCRHDLKMAQKEYDLTEERCASLDLQYAGVCGRARLLVEPYRAGDLSVGHLDILLDDLTGRRDKWRQRQAEKEDRGKLINDDELELAKKQTLHNKLDEDLRIRHRELEKLQDELDQLNRERQDLFADKNPDDVEKQLADAVRDAEGELQKESDELRQAQQDLKNLQEKIEAAAASTQARSGDLAQMEQAWLARLIRLGFAGEDDYRGSCLDEPEFKKLLETAESLKNEQLEISTLMQDKAAALNSEREKNITDRPYAELQSELSACEGNVGIIRQEIGALKQILDQDEQARRTSEEILKSIEVQTRELARWNTLHELIGSADGKKYRNFAQGLTFQTMVSYANRQLAKMTDRYLLTTDDSGLLELDVIDNYQAGEIRSTKNLSGGESFIVSLALALGLSGMASRNVRIDSFFLDEGFGSLDEYALDTALETLAGLHQEGKIIGVISHVPALKERISTQIQVIPRTGGRSIISGPGCEKVSEGR